MGFLRAGSRSRDTTGKTISERHESALLPAGEATPGETSERCVRTRARCEDPQGAWSGASGSGRGAHRGSSEAGGDVAESEMRSTQRHREPTREFRVTG